MLELVAFGLELEFILDLDFLAFDSMVARVCDIRSEEKVMNLWLTFAGAQGTKNSVKELAKTLSPKSADKPGDVNAFLRQWENGGSR